MTFSTRVTQDRPEVTVFSMNLPRLGQRALRGVGSLCTRVLGLVLASALLALAMPGPAAAQGKLEAQYEATLAGIPVG